MVDSWSSYPKIYALGHRAIADLFSDESVLVQEKVDGSQFSFGVFNDELRIKSKSAMIDPDAPPKLFGLAVDTVQRLATDLNQGWTYRGEAVCKPKHNTLAYDRVPAGGIILFDINDGLESYLPYEQVTAEAARLGLEAVPKLVLREQTPSAFADLLETTSVLGGQKIEGVVVKNYHRYGRDGKCLMGKFVSERFKEVHAKTWKLANPSRKDSLAVMAQKFRSEARWDKAIQHLREAGQLTDSPKDIGPLMKEVSRDVLEECADEIKEALFKDAWKTIHKQLTTGLPEWYKNKLMERQFDGKTQETLDDRSDEAAVDGAADVPVPS